MITWTRIAALAATAAIFVGCATIPPPTYAPEPSAIKAATPGFSPTGSEDSRVMRLPLVFGAKASVQSYEVKIASGSVIVAEWSGVPPDLPEEIVWDGLNRDGKPWPEGKYLAMFSVNYGDKFEPSPVSWIEFTLTSGPPAIQARATPDAFTPAGKGMSEPVTIGIDAKSPYARIAGWTIAVLDPRGQVVRNFEGKKGLDAAVWDGQTSAGAWVEPSKTYTANIRVADEYGNVGSASLAIDVRGKPDPTEASMIRPLSPGFSPTGDQGRRKMEFGLSFGNKELVQSWVMEIMTGSNVVYRVPGRGSYLPPTLSWDGAAENGASWPEGEYRPYLTVDYGQAFNSARVSGSPFYLVSSQPAVQATATPPAFTPAGLGMAEPVTIAIDARSRFARTADWSIEIRDARGQVVKSFAGPGPGGSATWDGMTASGAWIEPSKTYSAKVRVRDEYGNAGEASVAIEVKAQPDATEPSEVKALFPGFSPTGDQYRRTIEFALRFGNAKLVQSWALEIATGDITVKRYAGKGGALPTSLTWDGTADNGLPWPEGDYWPVLSIDYGQVYNPAKVTGKPFTLVSSPPAVKASASPAAFTPSGAGMAEAVVLSLQADSKRSRVASWTATFLDPKGATMRAFNGTGASGQVSWDGSSAAGAWGEPGKTYYAKVVARDEYGNSGETTVSIPVRDMPEAPAASLIDVDRKGFSPASQRFGGRIDLSLIIGAADRARSWKVEISDGKVVRRTFSGTGSDAPATLSWDGLDDAKARAPDGTYSALLAVDYGRTYRAASARTKDFVLASSAPTAKLTASPDAFTPTEEGVTGPVALVLEAAAPIAKIDSWTLEILDAQGKTVQSFQRSWPTNQAMWDGKTLAGSIVEAGSSFRARATVLDEYGNAGSATASVSVKDIPAATERSRIEPRSTGFSPVGAGKPRSMDFILLAGNADRLKTWKLVISHSERGAQRSFSGTASSLSGNLSWDGRTDAGAAAPDGSYYATLSLDYGKSFRPAQVRSAAFALQSEPPEATLTLSPSALKPKAGAFEKPTEITLRASARYAEIESWIISVLDPAGKAVRLFNDATAGAKFSWDGKTSAGGYLDPSTTYTVVAEVRDSYGNAGSAKAQLTVGDLPPVPGENSIVPAAAGLSPNGDGTMDSIDLRVSVTNREAMRSWKILISHAEKGPLKTFSGDASSLGAGVTWLGRSDAGELSPEGAYTALLTVDYGTTFKPAQATSRRFVLATSSPRTAVSVSPKAVVPDEQGFVSPARFALDASSALARMSSWSLDIVDASGKALASLGGDWPPSAIGWNGVMEDGKLAEPNTSYTAVATVLDEFGNAGQAQAPIIVAGFPTATEESYVKALSRGFSPAAKGSMRFSLGFGNRNLVKSWRLEIEREDKTVRLRYPGDGSAFPETFTWDGRLVDGTTAPDGRYSASLYIDYGRVYSAATATSAVFALASAPPAGSITINPGLFSPDGDGSAETCAITLAAVPQYAAISDWSVEIQDPAGNPFMSWRGQWPAAPIVWDGKNAKGDTVESAEDYPLVARLRDEFGNASEVKSVVKVDILVTKVGEEYRLRVGGVTFKSFTADYMDVPEEQALRNAAILDLLANKLKKFPGYQIKMVGHAVMTSWDDPAKGKVEQEKVLIPLSKSRAEAIRQALIARGIEASRMTAEGAGAADPIVPDSDLVNRWKNRRVEFFLKRK